MNAPTSYEQPANCTTIQVACKRAPNITLSALDTVSTDSNAWKPKLKQLPLPLASPNPGSYYQKWRICEKPLISPTGKQLNRLVHQQIRQHYGVAQKVMTLCWHEWRRRMYLRRGARSLSAATTASEQTTCDAHTYWLTACLHSGTPTTPARAVRTTPGLAWPSSELEFYYWQRRTPRFAAAITGDQVAEAAASGLCSSLVYIAQMLWICTMSRAAVFETSCLRHCANMPLIKQFRRLRQET